MTRRPHLPNRRHPREETRPRTRNLRLNLPTPTQNRQLDVTRLRRFWTRFGVWCGVYSAIVTTDAPLNSVGARRILFLNFALPRRRLTYLSYHEQL